jgi:hypothetical protein
MSTEMWRSAALAAALVGAWASPAAAQWEAAAWNTPGWTFTPSVRIGVEYDSNVALADAPASTGETASDRLVLVTPSGQIDFLSPRTTFSAGYRGHVRRYLDVTPLNGVDHSFNIGIRRLATKRLTLEFGDTYTDVPTTDDVELNGVPFSRTGTRTNSFNGGVTARLTKFTDLSVRYEHTWVSFDRDVDNPAQNFLLGGTVHGLRAELGHRLNDRVTAGGEYGFRTASLNQGLRELTFHDAGAGIQVALARNTSLSASAGVSFLIDELFDLTRTGPFLRLSLSHDIQRATVGASFERSFVPSFGLGGSSQNQELRGFVRMPIAASRFYVQGSAAWRHSDPFVETEQLGIDTIYLRSTVGYATTRWLRIEGFYTYTRQDSIVTGGEIDRNRAGVQFVFAQPMRIR